MCEPYPGPRCSKETGDKLQQAVADYQHALEQEPNNTTQATLAHHTLQHVQRLYDTTTDGIKTLRTRLEQPDLSEELKQQYTERLAAGTRTRASQHDALAEERNGRKAWVAEQYAVSPYAEGFTATEIAAIIDSTREQLREQPFTPPATDLGAVLNLTADEPHLQGISDESAAVYSAVRSNLTTARAQLNEELTTLAHMNHTSPAITSAYFAAYKQQYETLYASKPAKDRPDPPKAWVRGDYPGVGYANNTRTQYIPADKATMYALHRLRADQNAIPDYLTHQAPLATITTDVEHEQFTLNTYTPAGQQTTEQTFTLSQHNLQEAVKGKTLVLPTPPKNAAVPHIAVTDYARQCQQLSHYTPSTLSYAMDADSQNPVELLSKLRKHSQKIWNSKPARRNAPQAETTGF